MDITILGFGTMGRQICALLSILGHSISVWTRSGATQEKIQAYEREKKIIAKRLAIEDKHGRVTFVGAISELTSALTIEALAEDLSLKKEVISQLSYTPRALFTNTSSFSPQEVAPGAVGLHFFNPLYMVKLVEVSADSNSMSSSAQEFIASLATSGLQLVHTKSNRGYIGNYILFNEISCALKLVERFGYSTESVDTVTSLLGQSASLFDIVDLVGVDVTKQILENLREEDPTTYVPYSLAEALKRGILGRKNRTTIRTVIDEHKVALAM